ncbi:MAG: hypothetical protein WA738_16970 [Candidatus Angelobacter sp.]
MNMSDEMLPSFNELSRYMARNHIYLSVRKEDYAAACRSMLNEKDSPFPPKVVIVVGAGASNDACGLPTGEQGAQALRDAFKRRVQIDERLIDEEIHRITVEYRLDQRDFEAVLLALSKFDQSSVLAELKTIYNRRHYPSLTYEVLAHWLKHRFIDAIVNFNFDELLDEAINDEIGPRGYYRVISDGDCPGNLDNWLDQRERFKFPLYIKPHGTASHKSTMRFTRASYSLLPVDLVGLLTKLFEGSVEILIAGHAMQSVEFNDILGVGVGGSKLKFYALGHEKPKFRIAGSPGWSDCEFWDTKPTGGVGKCINHIATWVEESFNPGFVPRSINRHRLIDQLFHREVETRQNEIVKERFRYLQDRVYVEIALAVSKAKGFINLEHLARGRAGQYFREMTEAASKLESKPEPISMLDMCRDLGLDDFGYSNDTVCLRTRGNRNNRLERPTLSSDEFEIAAVQLAETTRNHLSEEQQKKPLNHQEVLREIFMHMYRGEEVEVSSNTRPITNHIFASPVPLRTFTSLHAQTDKMLRAENWDAILCTAESGKWLLQERWSTLIKKCRAGIAIIVADETYRERLENEYKDKLGLLPRLRWLPWWMHNRHATVLLKDRQPVQAIFYERRLRTSHIAPLWLGEPDAKIAMHAFVAYWIKAQQYGKKVSEIEIKPQQVEEASQGLIEDLYRQPPKDGA